MAVALFVIDMTYTTVLFLLTIPLFNCLTTKVGIVLVCPVNNLCVCVGVESVVHYNWNHSAISFLQVATSM